MLILLFSIFLICFGVYYYIIDQKLSTQKTQLRILSRQNREFKLKIESSHSTQGPIIIKYRPPLFKTGTTKESCSLYLSPIESSPVLSTIVKGTSIGIQDSAEIFNVSWYEISLNSQNNINNKGWIKKEVVVTVDDVDHNQDGASI
ncbi:hypothetical protein [Clostridium psychrophilum]|uniref:hypothetical protein n=1 Tax=Clostridium psychrophilum TaxID=132926 RepID=UPI001C0CC26C|nr:hypothetical protein [Clostridium psychrophilum]MBU3180367.1 hypothetical protein [Clostridium psychrophilum]